MWPAAPDDRRRVESRLPGRLGGRAEGVLTDLLEGGLEPLELVDVLVAAVGVVDIAVDDVQQVQFRPGVFRDGDGVFGCEFRSRFGVGR